MLTHLKEKLQFVQKENEVLTTERHYVRDLRLLAELFVAPLRAQPEGLGLKRDEVVRLFSNVVLVTVDHID